MKTKNISFIVGLIGLILNIIISFYGFFALTLIHALLKSNILLAYSIYLIPISMLIEIIGVCLIYKKGKTAGVLLIISFILNIIPYVSTLILTNDFDSIKLLLILFIPNALIIVSAILNLLKKKTIV